MYVAPAFRGTGLGRRILARLDEIALEHGCRAVRLDTSDYLTPAVGLYRAAGYREVPAYNENPKADLWFERGAAATERLSCSGPSGAATGSGSIGDAVDVDLEVEVAADAGGVAGLADRADPLALPAPARPRRTPAGRAQVGVEVAAVARLRRGSAGSCRRGPGRSRCRSTRPLRTATSGVPQAAVTSKPSWMRPPLRGASNSPIAPRTPCGPWTGKTWP